MSVSYVNEILFIPYGRRSFLLMKGFARPG